MFELTPEQWGQRWEEVWEFQGGHQHDVFEHGFDLFDEIFRDFSAEANADQDTANGETAVAHHVDEPLSVLLGVETVQVVGNGPVADPRE